MSDLSQQRLDQLDADVLPLDDEVFRAGAQRVLSFSDYAFGVLQRHGESIAEEWARDGFAGPFEAAWVALDDDTPGTDEARALAALRQARHRFLLRILWRDVNGLADIDTILLEQSRLAEALIGAALELARHKLANFGTPRNGEGEPVDLIVFGLGKLGAHELNFSSDVDLVYAYAEPGETDGRRRISSEQYFAKLASQLTGLLSKPTADGFCYRVDLRLRPFGDAGRVALSATAMEQYFQREGRDWERYAWIKARTVAGDAEAGQEILKMLRPFVFRRYLDYGAFESLREMKAMIRAEVARRDLADHIKLGRGGIREIEFFAQAFQLIRGGREPSLRRRSLFRTLTALAELGEIEPEQAERLADIYRFLRRLENRFQQVRDEQTHEPPEQESLRAAIAATLSRESWSEVATEWARHREYVARRFEEVFEVEEIPAASELDRWRRIWSDPAGGDAGEDWRAALAEFRDSGAIRDLGERGRKRLDRLMPHLLQCVAGRETSADATLLRRSLGVVTAIARRSTYLALLAEQEEVLEHLVALCSASPWLADKLARHPLMLDELIDRRSPDASRSPAEHLTRRLESAGGDLELEMEILREVRDSRMISLAAAFLDGRLAAPAISERLTAIADAVLGAVSRLAWRDLTARYGNPGGDAGLAIIGYGTLGGGELSFGSDLDLIFLYSGTQADGNTEGDRSIANPTFFTRLSQRILHLLTTVTPSGRLYEVDVRLRPNGRAGLLVSSLEAFAEYQRNQAWTWELQALTRARWVAGAGSVREPFEAIRKAVVCEVRENGPLVADVVEMRDKMRAELDRSSEAWFDLKQGAGGRVDLEFIAQYARLRWAHEHRLLAQSRSTVDTLRRLGELGLLDEQRAERLVDAYRSYQQAAMSAALAKEPPRFPAGDFKAHRAVVIEQWRALFGANSLP